MISEHGASLVNRVAFVTGAARGQGRAEAVVLAQAGARIIAADICRPIMGPRYPMPTEDDLAETARLVREAGSEIITGRVDVRELAALEALVASGVEVFGRLDIVVATAGISTWSLLADMDEDTWQTMIDINLTGVWKTMTATVPALRASGGGSIVVKGSVAAVKALPLLAHYSAAKAGLLGLVRAAAIELAADGIRVNVIHPWGVNTPMGGSGPVIAEEWPQFAASFSQVLGAGPCEPEDIAGMTLFLASDAAAHVTGAEFLVDMGATLV